MITTNMIKFESVPIRLSAKKQMYELKQDKNSELFTIYSFLIVSQFRSWIIKKRYSDFEALSNILSKKYHNKLPIPPLPPKRWQKNSKETSEERLNEFEKYLNSLFTSLALLLFEEIVIFINLGFDLINLYYLHLQFIKKEPIVYNETAYKLDSLNGSNYYDLLRKFKAKEFDPSKNLWMFLIEEFLRNLIENNSFQSDIITLFKAFISENYTAMPHFHRSEIKIFYIGFEDAIGILAYVGFYRENPFGSEACLSLVNTMLSIEFNRDSDEFIAVLKEIKSEYIQKMYLDYMILNKKNAIQLAVFKFLASIGYDMLSIREALSNENAINEYLTWTNKTKSLF